MKRDLLLSRTPVLSLSLTLFVCVCGGGSF